jgi:G3E family GTPase
MLPLLIVTGFLGSGKTTLLQRALNHPESRLSELWRSKRLLLLVNDFASENVDAILLQESPQQQQSTTQLQVAAVAVAERHDDNDSSTSHALHHVRWNNTDTTTRTVDLSGGCVCCNLLPVLLMHLRRSVASQQVDYVIVELTGLASPVPVAGAVLRDPVLAGAIQIDAIVCVVDAASYSVERDPLAGEQLLGANVIVANKWSLAEETRDPATLCHLEASLRAATGHHSTSAAGRGGEGGSKLSPVRFYTSDYSNVALDELVVGRGLFSLHESAAVILSHYAPPASLSRLTRLDDPLNSDDLSKFDEMGDDAELAREMETIGARSFVYRVPVVWDPAQATRVPIFCPRLSAVEALVRVLCSTANGVWRSKGFFIAADDGENIMDIISRAGEPGCSNSSNNNADNRQHDASAAPAAAAAGGGAGIVVPKHFRWSSVGTQFEYNEVTFTAPMGMHNVLDKASRITETLATIVFIGAFSEAVLQRELDTVFLSKETHGNQKLL